MKYLFIIGMLQFLFLGTSCAQKNKSSSDGFSQAQNDKAKAQDKKDANSLTLTPFKDLPAAIDGCACFFSKDKEAWNKQT